jgi:dipeptidyl aminopeptidase/acylaminoacyl peptidase
MDHTVCHWDLTTGRELAVLRGPAGATVSALAVSPDGKLLATAGDPVIRLWETATGQVARELDGPAGKILSLAFSPDGKYLASGGYDRGERHVCVLDVATGREPYPVETGGDHYYAVRFSPDGKWLAGNTSKEIVEVWDAATGKRKREFAKLIDFAFLSDSKYLVSWGNEEEVRVRDLETGHTVYGFPGPSRVRHLGHTFVVSPDGRLLAFFSGAKDLQLWELATGKLRSTFAGWSRFDGLAFTPDSRALLAAREDTTVLVWGLAGQTEQARPNLTESELPALWADLASDDGVRAGRAVRSLTAAGGPAVALLKANLRPVRDADPARVAGFIADLDAEQFAVRTSATRELKALGELAEPALRKALKDSPALEARRRLEDLLATVAGPITVAGKARGVRAVEVLERVGTPEAAVVLTELAQGAPPAWLTREARAALARLGATPRDVP